MAEKFFNKAVRSISHNVIVSPCSSLRSRAVVQGSAVAQARNCLERAWNSLFEHCGQGTSAYCYSRVFPISHVIIIIFSSFFYIYNPRAPSHIFLPFSCLDAAKDHFCTSPAESLSEARPDPVPDWRAETAYHCSDLTWKICARKETATALHN